MKKILAAIIITLLLVPNFILKAEAKNTWYFVVTAYYSPLPNQNFYLTWNYKSEKRLNWQWIRWASWKWVFSGMLAGPKNYKFWTNIYLEWLGVWEISDRWWAIVSAWNRWYRNDRIDVWVWYGDEWLRRALYWWKRTIKWRIINKNNEVTLDYNIISAPKWATTWLKTVPNIFKKWIGKWSNYTNVVKLQTLLKETWLYNWKMDWIYNNTIIDIIYSFQIKNWLIKSWRSYWAGYWWWTTRKLFLKKYLNWDFDKNTSYKKEIINTKKELNIFSWPVNNIDKIKKLQEILNALGYYNWKITWVKKDIIDPIYDFQKSQGIVKYTYSPWAWSYWPKTRSSLEKEYKIYQDKIEKERKEKIKIEEDIRKEQERKRAEKGLPPYKRAVKKTTKKATKKKTTKKVSRKK